MAYLGKEFVHQKDENFDGFLKSTGLSEEKIQAELKQKPRTKYVKNSDGTYTFSTTVDGKTKETTFKPGVEFDDVVGEGKAAVKTKFTIDGDVWTQVIKAPNGEATFKRAFNGNDLVVSITSSNFDGVAKRYYKA